METKNEKDSFYQFLIEAKKQTYANEQGKNAIVLETDPMIMNIAAKGSLITILILVG